ncbi:MAG: hypothetical protein JKY96_02650 [Phycisphaerales bacterium]|nr:hypothetical protein [Phycisphaerales bacterium]
MSDQWHTHSADEPAPQLEQAAHVSPKWLALTLIAIVFGVLFVIIVLVVYYNNYMSKYDASINETTTEAQASFEEKIAVQTTRNSFEWIDRENGIVQIPVDMAMDLVIADYEGAGS